MKTLFIPILLSLSAAVQADLNILACEPEWASLSQILGGDKINVSSATTAQQDPHHIQARPSLIAKARRADLLACTGADLEIGWLPLLIKKSANPSVREGQPGHFMATDKVQLLNIPDHVDRSMGDVHAAGNPHIQLDPHRILTVASSLSATLKQIDPSNAAYYQQRWETFEQDWNQAINKWEQQASRLKDMNIVIHHDNWVYLEEWLKLNQLGMLEPKPGVPPSASHLAELSSDLSEKKVEAIVYSSYQNSKAADWLADKIHAPAVMLPSTVGATEKSNDLFGLFDDILSRLNEVK